MKYYEGKGDKRQLCRVENFAFSQWINFLLQPDIMSALEQLMGEPFVLYKEK